MRMLITVLVLLMLNATFCAERILVHKKNGTTDIIEVNSDTKITFSDGNINDKMRVLKTNNTTDVYNLSDVVVISFSNTSVFGTAKRLKEIPVSLLTNYPNPFNPSTNISFDLRKSGMVTVTIYNQKGEFVKELLKQDLIAGQYNLKWDGDNSSSSIVPSGIYFSKVSIDGQSKVGRMTMVK